MSSANESAILLEVPEAEALVAPWRRRFDPVANHGIPGHITVLYPFVPGHTLDDDELAPLLSVLSSTRSFSFELVAVDEFPDVVWLRPGPSAELTSLLDSVHAAYPYLPPYGGQFPDTQPHLTLVHGIGGAEHDALRDRIAAEFATHLPIACTATKVAVFGSDADGEWTRHRVIPLGDH